MVKPVRPLGSAASEEKKGDPAKTKPNPERLRLK
jgi:hypothetical protein